MELHALDRTFYGSIACRRFAGIRVFSFQSSGHVLSRDRTLGAESACDLLVSLQVGGGASAEQNGHAVRIGAGAGAIGLLDLSRPFELSFPESVQRIFVLIPLKTLRGCAPWLVHPAPLSLPAENPLAGILREHMINIGGPACAWDARSAEILIDSFLGVLSLATVSLSGRAREKTHERTRALNRLAVQAYLRKNLSDPDLSPEHAARYLGQSSRSIHKLFEGSGATLGRWLRNQRLDVCFARLRARDGARIAEIAYEAGFADLSHFNRSFKQRFGRTPRECRDDRSANAQTTGGDA
jgi:AraC-like DNA-binding protein